MFHVCSWVCYLFCLRFSFSFFLTFSPLSFPPDPRDPVSFPGVPGLGKATNTISVMPFTAWMKEKKSCLSPACQNHLNATAKKTLPDTWQILRFVQMDSSAPPLQTSHTYLPLCSILFLSYLHFFPKTTLSLFYHYQKSSPPSFSIESHSITDA